MQHRCPDGAAAKLVRTGPVGTMEGVTFHCPRCGHSRKAEAIMASFEARRPLIVAALSR